MTPIPPARASEKRKSPLIAVVLSGIFPGLGQLYTGERLKGWLFILAGVVTAFGPWNPLEVEIDLNDLSGGLRNVLLASLPFLALVVWSSIDAYRAAGRRPAPGGAA